MWHMPPWKCFIHLAYCLRDSVVDLPHKCKSDWLVLEDVERNDFYDLEDFEHLALSLLDGVDMTASAERGRLLLECAVETGSTAVVEAVLNKGVDINGVDNDGRTALHTAIFAYSHFRVDDDVRTIILTAMFNNCSPQVVKLLLDRGADVNAKDKYGQTAINDAASLGMREQVAMLLTRGADLKLKTSDGRTVLHSAAGAGNYDVVQLLFDEGVIDYKNNDMDIIINSLAIRSKPIHINAQDKLGNTALHCAVECSTSNPYNGRYEKTIKLLLDYGADTWVKNQNDKTALQLAIPSFKHGTNVVYFLLHKEMRANNNGMIHKVCQLLSDSTVINTQNYEGNTLLHIAVKNGHMDVVSILLQYGSDLGVVDRLGQTALHVAVKEGSGEMVRLLLQGNGLVNGDIYTTPHYTYKNVKYINGCTALHIAVQKGLADIESSLLNYGADIRMKSKNDKAVIYTAEVPNVNIQDNEGYTALHIAAVLGRRDVVSLLLEHGADKRVKTFTGVTVLHSAVQGSNVECLELIMKDGLETHENIACVNTLENTVDVNAQDDRGRTALHFAVMSSNDDMIRTLIRLNADLSLKNNGDSYTAVSPRIFKENNAEIVRMILEEVADTGNDNVADKARSFVNMQDSYGNTALHIALDPYDTDHAILNSLLCYGADLLYLKNENGETALQKALETGDLTAVKLLMNAGVDVNVTDDDGQTLLMSAAKAGHIDVVAEILGAGADIARRDQKGLTALHYASSGYVVNYLLKHGADIDAQSEDGSTPLHYAIHCKRGCFVIEALFSACYQFDKKDIMGKTVIDYCCENMEKTPQLDVLYMTDWGYDIVENEFNLKRTFGLFKAAGLLEHITERMFTLFNPAIDRNLTEEINEMKSTLVGDVCLYSVLNYQLTDLRFLANPEVISMIRSESFTVKFNSYHHLIKIRLLQARELPALLDEVSEVFAHSLSNTLELNIPSEVCRMILVRTSHFDLKKVNSALKASED